MARARAIGRFFATTRRAQSRSGSMDGRGNAVGMSKVGMSRILVTGMSGTGKSTLLAELRRRGYRTVDTDYEGWTGPESAHYRSKIDRLKQALASEAEPTVRE